MKTVDRRAGYWNREKETLSPAAREAYQDAWLARLVEHAWAPAPGVRRRLEDAGLQPGDVRRIDDLARVPVMKKSAMPDLQKADPPFGGFCTVPVQRLRRIFVSPGPILEPMGPELSAWHGETCLYAGGFRPGDVVVNTFGYQLLPAAHELDEALHTIGCVVVSTGVGNTDQQVTVATTVRATGYVGTPSFLMTILKRANEMGVGRPPFEVAQVGAEPFPESLRRVFQDEHGIMARQGFGTADLGMIAYECAEAAGMHLVEDVITQICDPRTGEPLPHGQVGEIVATTNNMTYPMIRFGTGDLSLVTDEPCACGRTSPRMLGWRGRADEVTKVRGVFVHPRQADEVVARVQGVRRVQVVVGREGHQDSLTMRVELAEGVDAAAARSTLESAIRDVMKLRGTVEVVGAGVIPEGAKKIADERTWE
ncbi:MAG: phenylacetate--CoA ligase family protein [Candidatus Rokubacteria bacterium]|nr:phenylacetate--CoA ligase family protein [Candidatus Rokubacteria bacterium]